MLRIVETNSEESLVAERLKEIGANDYLYILKYSNTFMLVDNGTIHYMNSIVNCTETEYDALTTVDDNLIYMVSKTVDLVTTYSIYYGGTRIDTHEHDNKELLDLLTVDVDGNLLYNGVPVDDTTNNHTHTNKDVIDKFSEDVGGGLLFNGAAIEGGTGGTTDLTAIQAQVDNLELRSTLGAELDYGYFTMGTSQTTVLNEVVLFDIIKNTKNLTINNGYIPLNKGKAYKIDCSLYASSTSGYCQYGIFESVTNTLISNKGCSASVNYSTVASNSNAYTIYTPSVDCYIYVKLITVSVAQSLVANFSYLAVEEIARTYIVDPMDVKDNYTVEYGEFSLTANQTTALTANSPVRFVTRTKGNIDINPLTYGIKLKANTLYKLEARILVLNDTNNYSTVAFKDITSGVVISKSIDCISSTIATAYNSQSSIATYYTPTIDSEVSLVIMDAHITTIFYTYSSLLVEEIAQSVVVEYNNYNEVSNPLTTTDISQESPIGSVISYTGLTTPEHHLKMDGFIYNITDYPFLAEHFLLTYGSYNYFGGDGITTFAVPIKKDVIKVIQNPVMTSNTAPSPYVVTASSVYNTTTYDSWKAFNGTNAAATDSWLTLNNVKTGWVAIDLNIPKTISSFRYKTRNWTDSSTTAPKDFTLQGSNDGVNFTILKTVTGQTGWTGGEARVYELDTYVSYRYYKFNITLNNGAVFTQVGELELLYDIPFYIKYEPTYYAVNQYGGFESAVLFDGSANAVGGYALVDNIENYDFIIVVGASSVSGAENVNSVSQTIPLSVIEYSSTYQFIYEIYSGVSSNFTIQYHFSSATILSIDGTAINGNYTDVRISKIIGYKGQLPTYFVGGEI